MALKNLIAPNPKTKVRIGFYHTGSHIESIHSTTNTAMVFSTPLNAPRLRRRALTWPLTDAVMKGMLSERKAERESTSAAVDHRPKHDPFLDDLEDHPEDHFLSPIIPEEYEYDDWSDDSDFDDEFEWDAGIMDFALFDDDRRRSRTNDLPVSNKWNDLLSLQASALRRADERNRASSTGNLEVPGTPPGLTPDTSPNNRDDMDYELPQEGLKRTQGVPNYLTVIVTPPTDDHVAESDVFGNEADDEDVPLSFFYTRKQVQTPTDRRLQRPGLRYGRTMSGKRHSWRQPSWDIYPVGEDVDAEREAEESAAFDINQSF